MKQQSLELGRPGQIVLEGGRLWRSTVVTLGSYQQATEIQVTPHMQGIVAKFACVQPPPDWPEEKPIFVLKFVKDYGDSENSVKHMEDDQEEVRKFALAVVWTSEGRTEPERILLRPFKTHVLDINGQSLPAELPCWDPRSEGWPRELAALQAGKGTTQRKQQ